MAGTDNPARQIDRPRAARRQASLARPCRREIADLGEHDARVATGAGQAGGGAGNGTNRDRVPRRCRGGSKCQPGESFPDATYSIICVDGERAGRLIVNHAADQILIVDIALLPEFRRTGIGSGLVWRLLDQADASHLPIRCHVLHDSAARRFWERAGFAAQGRDGVYLAMERAPQALPP